MLHNRSYVSTDGDRAMRLQEVGQVFGGACSATPNNCKLPTCGIEPCLGQWVKDATPDDDDTYCNQIDYGSWVFPGYFYSWMYPALSVPVYLCPGGYTTTGMFTDGSIEYPPLRLPDSRPGARRRLDSARFAIRLGGFIDPFGFGSAPAVDLGAELQPENHGRARVVGHPDQRGRGLCSGGLQLLEPQ